MTRRTFMRTLFTLLFLPVVTLARPALPAPWDGKSSTWDTLVWG